MRRLYFLLVAMFCMACGLKAQVWNVYHYPQIPLELDGVFVDCVKDNVAKVMPSAYGQYFGQMTPGGNIYGYGAFYTDQDGEVIGQFRNGTCVFGIRLGSQSVSVGTDDHYIVYDLRTSHPLYVVLGEEKIILPDDHKRTYRFESLTYANGDRYVGETVNGKREGYGLYYYTNGNFCFGRYKDNLQYGYAAMFKTDSSVMILDWEEKDSEE